MADITSPAAADLSAVQALLKASTLPFDDLTEEHLPDFLVAKENNIIVGTVGLEHFGQDALLRSLAVSHDHRRGGLAQSLLTGIEKVAVGKKVTSLVLLTTTEKDYFAKRGYREISRTDVPKAVQASAEFASICPASATCMQKQMNQKRVAFICVENSNRSQMAQAFARRYDGIEVHSAGSKPSGVINPRAVAMMSEKGILMSDQHSKSLDELNGEFDAVVTMGCGDACPWIPAKQRLDWALTDPKNVSDDEFRTIRDDIERRVESLVLQLRAQ